MAGEVRAVPYVPFKLNAGTGFTLGLLTLLGVSTLKQEVVVKYAPFMTKDYIKINWIIVGVLHSLEALYALYKIRQVGPQTSWVDTFKWVTGVFIVGFPRFQQLLKKCASIEKPKSK